MDQIFSEADEQDSGEPSADDDIPPGGSGGGVSRRAVLAAALTVAGSAAAATAVLVTRPRRDDMPLGHGRAPGSDPDQAPGRLLSRPGPVKSSAPPPGLHHLGLGTGRDGLLFVPAGHSHGAPVPLVVALHGAGGDAAGGLAPLRGLADAAGLVIMAPASRGATWDVIHGGYGPDVSFIDRALDHVFSRFTVDPGRVALEGFSDGASYALSLGIGNADLFSHCIAFSPGFLAPPARRGRLRAFVTHGVHDTVLPIDRCSRRIVPRLRSDGYDVDYREFDGGHVVPPDQAAAAVAWLTAP